ncbi:MAG: hypothetical protein JSS67_07710 [Bacteroidetes bacterium]|nr:hypothetical protein [Bacteroidota bacterium]
MNTNYLKIFRFLFTGAFIFFIQNAHAQVYQSLALQNINEENGLSDNAVQCIFQDNRHFTWIGTASGLNRVNGSGITVYKNNPSYQKTISSNFVNTIAQKNDSILLIGTKAGLDLMDVHTNQFQKLFYQHKDFSEPINCLSTTLQNIAFIGTPSGLFEINEQNVIEKILLDDTPSLFGNSNNITDMFLSNDSILWITTFNGLWRYDITQRKAILMLSQKMYPQLPTLFTSICQDDSRNFWIGTWGRGLIQFNTISGAIHLYPYGYNISSLVPIKTSKNNSLLGMNGDGICFDLEKQKFVSLPVVQYLPSKIQIKQTYVTEDKWIWLATDHGVYFYDPGKASFTIHPFSQSITNQDVSLLEWKGNILVGGSDSDFLKEYSPGLAELNNYGKRPFANGLTCLSLAFVKGSEITAGTNYGLITMDLSTKETEWNRMLFLVKNSPSNNFIAKVLHTSDDKWWIFPWRNGVWIKNPGEDQYKEFFKNFNIETNPSKTLVVNEALEDHQQNIWIADLVQGIIFYDHQSGKFSKPFQKELGDGVVISQIIQDKDSCYSFAANKFFAWNINGKGFRSVALPLGMDKDITSIALDRERHLWLSTNGGLLEYDFLKNEFIQFTISDGLPQNNLQGKLYCMQNGEMIFASADFLAAFNPSDLIAPMHETPQLLLDKIYVNDQPISLSGSHHFTHTMNHFVFQWTLTDYHNPLRNRYYYKLLGIDSEWRYAGNKGEVEFVNLSPGNYTLQMKAENVNGISSGNIIVYQFEIASPFWFTWWFIALMILGIAAIFYLLYLYRMKHLKRMDQLRNKISLDLHDDIGSTLSSISILSEMALQEEENKDMLNEIKENSLELMERMDDIVWSINPMNDSMEMLLLRVKTFSSRLFELKNIQYEFKISTHIGQLHIDMEKRRQIYLLLKEALNNIAKYSQCTKALVEVKYEMHDLLFYIQDNGIGFDEKNTVTGNGIHSMKMRAKWLNAQLSIQSAINEGTQIFLSMKIK